MRNGLKLFAALCAGVALGGVGVGIAAIPDSASGVISACMTKTGTIRVIDYQAGKRCRNTETLLTWNQKGVKGDVGAQGPQGSQGAPGTPASTVRIVDATGALVGEPAPSTVDTFWSGSYYFKYDMNSGERLSSAYVYFQDATCTGQGWLDGAPNLAKWRFLGYPLLVGVLPFDRTRGVLVPNGAAQLDLRVYVAPNSWNFDAARVPRYQFTESGGCISIDARFGGSWADTGFFPLTGVMSAVQIVDVTATDRPGPLRLATPPPAVP